MQRDFGRREEVTYHSVTTCWHFALFQDWHPPALHGFQNVWSLTDLTQLQKLLIALKDEKKIQFAQEFIDTFQRDVQAFEHMFNKCG